MNATGHLSSQLVLQLVCCSWVIVQVYFSQFTAVVALFRYRDFNTWFLPCKGEAVSAQHSFWLVIPFMQWIMCTAIACVSVVVICGFSSAFDAVMNSLAFTFIAEVAEFFNDPVVVR
jgi:hypothetical protein